MASCACSLALSTSRLLQQRQQLATQPFRAAPLRYGVRVPALLQPALPSLAWSILAPAPSFPASQRSHRACRLRAAGLQRPAVERRAAGAVVVRAAGGSGSQYVEEQAFRIERVRCLYSAVDVDDSTTHMQARLAKPLPCKPPLQVSFGSILAPIGLSLMVYGFGAFFQLLPGGDVSSLMLIYGGWLGGCHAAGWHKRLAQLYLPDCLLFSNRLVRRAPYLQINHAFCTAGFPITVRGASLWRGLVAGAGGSPGQAHLQAVAASSSLAASLRRQPVVTGSSCRTWLLHHSSVGHPFPAAAAGIRAELCAAEAGALQVRFCAEGWLMGGWLKHGRRKAAHTAAAAATVAARRPCSLSIVWREGVPARYCAPGPSALCCLVV